MLLEPTHRLALGQRPRLSRLRRSPAHYHVNCDEYPCVLSGKSTFWIGDAANAGEFASGNFLTVKRGIVHSLTTILEYLIVFLTIDAPRRDPKTSSS